MVAKEDRGLLDHQVQEDSQGLWDLKDWMGIQEKRDHVDPREVQEGLEYQVHLEQKVHLVIRELRENQVCQDSREIQDPEASQDHPVHLGSEDCQAKRACQSLDQKAWMVLQDETD